MEVKGTSGTIGFDGQTITITRRGFVQRSVSQGLNGTSVYPIGQISGVRIQKPGLHAGQFTLLTAGAADIGVRKASGGDDPMTVLFQRRVLGDMLALRDAIELAIRRPPSAEPTTPSAAADETLDQRLARLAGLHTAGHLTDEEFHAAKALVLGQGHSPADTGPRDARTW